jgi:hypothetical protein
MRNFVRVAQLALVPGFALITTGVASVAEADANLNAQLRGAYAVTVARTCTVSSLPFEGENLEIPFGAFVFSQTATDNGIATYNGDGTATFIGRTSAVNINSTGGSAIFFSNFTAAIEYRVNPDGTVDTRRNSSSFVVVLPATGITGTTTGEIDRLQISGGNTMLVSAPAAQVSVETQVSTTPAGIFTRYRVCARSTTQTKLPDQGTPSEGN